jgi:phospholipase C
MSSVLFSRSTAALVAAISLLAAGASGVAASPEAISPTNTRTPIKHVIVIVMENRSFDNLFHGYPGADTVGFGYGHTGNKIQLEPTPFEGNCDPNHSHEAWERDYNGGAMNGFDTTPPSCIGNVVVNPLDPGETAAQYPYGYLPYAEVKPYWELAKQFGMAQRMFASQTGPSYPGHMFIVAGTSGNQTDDPSNALIWGCDDPAGTTVPYLNARGHIAGTEFPCLYKQATMGNLLDRYNIPWSYYSNDLSYTLTGQEYDISTQPYDAFYKVRGGPDWQNDVVAHEGVPAEFDDILNGNLPTVSWFNPPVIASDHAQDTTSYGPDYVALIADALMASPAGYWKNTALFVTWDDPGGWYDHVVPQQIDNNGLGFRVPLIVVSKYAKRNYISNKQHEYASLLKFIEWNWYLPSLGTRDALPVTDNLTDMFDFGPTGGKIPPVPVLPIHPRANLNFFLNLKLDTTPLDYTPEE